MEGIAHSIYEKSYSLGKGVRGIGITYINVGIRYSTIYESLFHLYMCLIKREDLIKDVISLIVQSGFNVLFKRFLKPFCRMPHRWYVTREDSSTLAMVKHDHEQVFHHIPFKEGVIVTYFGERLFVPNALFLSDALDAHDKRAHVATRRAHTKTAGIVFILTLLMYVLVTYSMIVPLVSYVFKGLAWSLFAGVWFYVLRGLFRILLFVLEVFKGLFRIVSSPIVLILYLLRRGSDS